jgi:hypothetical protein
MAHLSEVHEVGRLAGAGLNGGLDHCKFEALSARSKRVRSPIIIECLYLAALAYSPF